MSEWTKEQEQKAIGEAKLSTLQEKYDALLTDHNDLKINAKVQYASLYEEYDFMKKELRLSRDRLNAIIDHFCHLD